MPVMEEHWVPSAEWLAMTPAERRRLPRPELIVEYRPVRRAPDAPTGFSMDEVGPYYKHTDGTIFRDRRRAASRLWRETRTNPALAQVVGWLPRRIGRDERVVRGRTAERVLEALVCRSLTNLGSTPTDASEKVIGWSVRDDRDERHHAEENRRIWRELRIPPPT